MIANTLRPGLLAGSSAISAVKRPTPVQVRFAEAPGNCKTLEGIVAYQPGDAILTGGANDTWPVTRSLFDERYVPAQGTVAGRHGCYVKRPIKVKAVQLEFSIDIAIAAGGILHGEPGDWLLQYSPTEYGIVKKEIFAVTYEIVL